MGWLENLGNAVSSGLAVVGDVAETIVETVTDTAENAVDAAADTAQEGTNYVVDWININGGPILGGIANVAGGAINGGIEAGLKNPTEGETRITSLTTFHVFVEKWDATGAVSSSEDYRGMTAGRDMKEGSESVGRATRGRTDGCCNVVQRQKKRDIGSGIAKRNVYPGFFSKVVMAHELGHYFGLCHINHNGVQNLMFSPDNKIFDWGLFRYYLRSEPHFSQRDERNVWRFIVDQLRNEL